MLFSYVVDSRRGQSNRANHLDELSLKEGFITRGVKSLSCCSACEMSKIEIFWRAERGHYSKYRKVF